MNTVDVMWKVRVGPDLSMVLPASLCTLLGVCPGDEIIFEEIDGAVTVVKNDPHTWLELMDELRGHSVWRGAAEEIERSRQEWEERDREFDRLRHPPTVDNHQ